VNVDQGIDIQYTEEIEFISNSQHCELKDFKRSNFSSVKTDSYCKAITTLKRINKTFIPYEKMMIIASISNEIASCINDFWEDMKDVISTSLLNINADELMTIFIYILIKSEINDLLVHSKIIKDFTTSATRSSVIGYYYTTLEASLCFILSINDKSELLGNKEALKASFNSLNNNSFVEPHENDY